MRYEIKAFVLGALERQPRETWRLVRSRLRGDGPIIKLSGLRNIEAACRYYASPDHFVQGVPMLRSPSRFDYLVAINFCHDEFVACDKPKVFCSLEPPQNLSTRTLQELDRTPPQQTLLFSDPDPDSRLYYPVLVTSKRRFIRRLERSIHRRRGGLLCLINRFTARPELELAQQRTRWARIFAQHIDIYGYEPYHGPNGWRSLPGYRGAARNKFRVLRNYDFTLAFESTDQPGYITEKLLGALLCGTVPLYWGGAGRLAESVPQDCLIECSSREPEAVLEFITHLPRPELIRLRRAGLKFLQSAQADRFTWAYWAEQLLRRLEGRPLARRAERRAPLPVE